METNQNGTVESAKQALAIKLDGITSNNKYSLLESQLYDLGIIAEFLNGGYQKFDFMSLKTNPNDVLNLLQGHIDGLTQLNVGDKYDVLRNKILATYKRKKKDFRVGEIWSMSNIPDIFLSHVYEVPVEGQGDDNDTLILFRNK